MIFKKKIILFVWCLGFIGTINAQTDTLKKSPNRLKVIGLPIVFFKIHVKLVYLTECMCKFSSYNSQKSHRQKNSLASSDTRLWRGLCKEFRKVILSSTPSVFY